MAMLYKYRERINPPAESTQAKLSVRRHDSELARFSFLFKYVRPERWWFEVADALRRIIMMGALVCARPHTHARTHAPAF